MAFLSLQTTDFQPVLCLFYHRLTCAMSSLTVRVRCILRYQSHADLKAIVEGQKNKQQKKYTLFVPLLIDIYHSHCHSSPLASFIRCRPSISRIFFSRHAISCQVLPANIPSSTSHLYKSRSMPAPSQFFFPSTLQTLSITTLKGNTATTRDWDKRNNLSKYVIKKAIIHFNNIPPCLTCSFLYLKIQ